MHSVFCVRNRWSFGSVQINGGCFLRKNLFASNFNRVPCLSACCPLIQSGLKCNRCYKTTRSNRQQIETTLHDDETSVNMMRMGTDHRPYTLDNCLLHSFIDCSADDLTTAIWLYLYFAPNGLRAAMLSSDYLVFTWKHWKYDPTISPCIHLVANQYGSSHIRLCWEGFRPHQVWWSSQRERISSWMKFTQ